MSVVLITSCSNRKSLPVENRLQAVDLPRDSLKAVADSWRNRLKTHCYTVAAGNLYSGRGSLEAKKAAEASNASHWFISAGLGLVSAKEDVPAYDLTVSGDSANQISRKIREDSFDSQAWWLELTQSSSPNRTLARLINEKKRSLIVLAIPSNYLYMVLKDLDATNKHDLKRLRIIGPPKSAIPDHLQPYWLPYDSRLDSKKSPIPGTRSDFPQRAARHFLENIWPSCKQANVQQHAESVRRSLAKLPFPDTPHRQKLSDEMMQEVIRKLWASAKGQSSRMLRMIRDSENIACEQGRFRSLFNQVKQQVKSKK